MPKPKGQEQGIRNSITLRTGLTLPEWHGINKERDPGAIDDAQFQELINVRLIGGRIDCRGGQTKLNSTPMDGCIIGLFDSETEWQDEASAGKVLLFQSFNKATPTTAGSSTWSETTGLVAAGAQSGLTEIAVAQLGWYPPEAWGPIQAFVRDRSSTLLLGIDNGNWASTARLGPDGDMYIGYRSGGHVGILNDDGTVIIKASLLGSSKALMVHYEDAIWAFGLVKAITGSGSSWSLVTMPTALFLPVSYAVYRGVLYISGRVPTMDATTGVATILSCDGVTISVAHQPSDASGAAYVGGMAVLNGNLYYSWTRPDPIGDYQQEWICGKFDGTTWTDVHGTMHVTMPAADLSALRTLLGDPTATRSWGGGPALVSYKGYLYSLGAVRATSGEPAPENPGSCFHYLIRSADGVTWSTVVRTHPITEMHGDYSEVDMVVI